MAVVLLFFTFPLYSGTVFFDGVPILNVFSNPPDFMVEETGVTISGRIVSRNNEAIEGIVVHLSGTVDEYALTNGNGEYQFSSIPLHSAVTITPEGGDSFLNVNMFDLALLLKHLFGELPIDDPYQLIAADVNGSGTITVLDYIYWRQIMFGLEPLFGNYPSWKFIPADYEFPEGNPFIEPYPEVIQLNDLTADAYNMDFVAVKIGDLN